MKKSQKLDMSVPPKEDLSLIRHPHNYPLVFETMLMTSGQNKKKEILWLIVHNELFNVLKFM